MPTRTIITLAQCLAICAITLVTGAVFGIWQGVVLADYSPQAYLEVHQGMVRGLNVLLPVMGFSTIVLAGLLAWLSRRHRRVMFLYLAALLCAAAAGIVTRFFNQPINAQAMNWTADTMPAGWASLRDTWWHWHIVRLFASAAASLFLIFAVFEDRDATARTTPATRRP